MADKDAPPFTVSDEAARSAEGMTELIPVARLLRANLDELIAGRSGEDSALGMRAILQFAAPHLRAGEFSSSSTRFRKPRPAAIASCGHICPQHPSQLDPVIWSRLPEEVLEVIFAKLPVPEIHRLRCLSTRWKRNLVEKSRFRELCAKTSSRMFALICEDIDWYGLFWVKLYDTGTNKWHVYKLFVGSQDEPFQTMSAADGGLVCFLSAWQTTDEYPLHVVVCNPLTQHVKTFVLEELSTHQVELLQIVTDRDTGHYKLIVAGHRQIPLLDAPDYVHFVVDMFDSRTEEWISLDFPGEDQPRSSDLFWGIRYNWFPEGLEPEGYMPESNCVGPCVWDCAELHLNELDNIPIREDAMEDYALLRDRLFVLHEESKTCFVGDPENRGSNDSEDSGSNDDDDDDDDDALPNTFTIDHYCISEYQGRTQQPNWVRLRTISCSPFKLPPSTTDYRMRLHACEGFLLVVAFNDEWYTPYDHEIGWLYDLITDEWHALPSMPGGVKLQDIKDSFLCELRWDVDLNPLNVPDAEQFLLPVSALSDEA